MSSEPDEGPVYYREIQKNAYLKRIPNDENTSKLKALGSKKPPLKAMWTLFCVHNGDTPFLEQYEGAACEATRAHRPAWRACLRTARHVTASVQPRAGRQYDFLVDTDLGPVRMLAPDWDTMQEWVTTLRAKLHELRIVGPAQNVYGAPPAAPPPRAAARDPASPLPPPPPGPLRPVPGIELHTPLSRPIAAIEPPTTNTQNSPPDTNNDVATTSSSNHTQNSINSIQNSITTNVNSPSTSNSNKPTNSSQNSNSFQNSITFPQNSTQNSITFPQNSITSAQNSITFPQNSINSAQNSITFPQTSLNTGPSSINLPAPEDIDISSWDTSFSSLPSTSQEKLDPKKSVAKICGQNICLDDSILKRNGRTDVTDSDEEFFAEIDRIHDSAENLNLGDDNFGKYKQRVMVTDGERVGLSRTMSVEGKQRANVTVIQVSNRPPHTAIPVLGPETDVFDFNFKQNLKITDRQDDFINIVNTESHLTSGNGYGTVFSPSDSDYGHLSLTTTVSVKPDVKADVSVTDVKTDVNLTEGVYERLCLASTSNTERASPLSVRRVKMGEKTRKSSLPNLELSDSTYEYLYPNANATVTVNTVAGTESSRSGNNNRVDRSDSQRRIDRPVPPVESMVRPVERSNSQNAYDGEPRRESRRVQNDSPKRETKNDKPEPQPKPIWKRGLTELSLLSKLRGKGSRRQSPPAPVNVDRVASSPVKVVRRSRPEVRVDSARRRSSSLSNGQSPPGALQPLRARQAAWLRAEQRRGASAAAASAAAPPLLADCEGALWVARWGISGTRCNGRAGDRVAALGGIRPTTLQQARAIFKNARTPLVDILFHRVPLGKIYVINRKDNESLGFKLDSECTIVSVEGGSPAARVGIPPPGKWCITEVNNRPINLVKGGEEEIHRLCTHGTEVSILIQPAALVKKLRAAIKSSKPLLSIR